MAEKYLSVEDVAKELNITIEDVIAATTQRQLNGLKDGTSWKFRRDEVNRYKQELQDANGADDDFGYGNDYELDDDEVLDLGGSSDINSTLDNDVTFSPEESGLALSDYVDDDDDLVLGEDPDLTGSQIGGSALGLSEQSGISLMSATDSGISLDDDESGEVLELGEDDLTLGSSLLSGSLAASLSVDSDDFALTTDDSEDGDDEDSGSQVIMVDDMDEDGGFGMDELGDPMEEGAEGDAFAMEGGEGGESMEPITQMVPQIIPMDMPEKPYSIWTILGLIVCFAFLTTTLLFTVDLIRNIWSWDKTPFSSALMDWVIDTFINK